MTCTQFHLSLNLNGSFAGQIILGCSFSFHHFKCIMVIPLACRVSARKSGYSLREVLLYVVSCFSLAAFNILFNFSILIIMCFYMDLFGLILFGTPCASWTWISASFPGQGSFQPLCLQICSPFGMSVMHMSVSLMLSHRCLKLSLFFKKIKVQLTHNVMLISAV